MNEKHKLFQKTSRIDHNVNCTVRVQKRIRFDSSSSLFLCIRVCTIQNELDFFNYDKTVSQIVCIKCLNKSLGAYRCAFRPKSLSTSKTWYSVSSESTIAHFEWIIEFWNFTKPKSDKATCWYKQKNGQEYDAWIVDNCLQKSFKNKFCVILLVQVLHSYNRVQRTN